MILSTHYLRHWTLFMWLAMVITLQSVSMLTWHFFFLISFKLLQMFPQLVL